MAPTSPIAPDEIVRLLPLLTREERQRLDELIASPATLSGMLFGPQHAYVADRAKNKTALCSRRAGKTVACAVSLLEAARGRDGAVALYITKSRVNARRIVWRTLLRLNRLYKLGGEPNETEASLRFANESTIYLLGAKDRDRIEDYRGLALVKAIIDEAQSMPGYLREMIEDVLEPALMDFDGSIELIGTPGPIPKGFFYDRCHDPKWSAHHWTVFDNPWILEKSKKTPEQHLQETLARRGVGIDDPSIQREWFGQWVLDRDSLVYAYDSARNDYTGLPRATAPWRYVIGVDLGFEDSDAICVLAYNAHSVDTYLVEEAVEPKRGVTDLALRVKGLFDKYGRANISAAVVDAGGLGKKIVHEMNDRHSLPVRPADKAHKDSAIEILNDGLRTGALRLPPGSKCAAAMMTVEWDRDRSTPERRVVRGHMPDELDALLYAYRESLAWTSRGAPATPEQEAQEDRELIARIARPDPAERERQMKEDLRRARAETEAARRREERTAEIDLAGFGGAGAFGPRGRW